MILSSPHTALASALILSACALASRMILSASSLLDACTHVCCQMLDRLNTLNERAREESDMQIEQPTNYRPRLSNHRR